MVRGGVTNPRGRGSSSGGGGAASSYDHANFVDKKHQVNTYSFRNKIILLINSFHFYSCQFIRPSIHPLIIALIHPLKCMDSSIEMH